MPLYRKIDNFNVKIYRWSSRWRSRWDGYLGRVLGGVLGSTR